MRMFIFQINICFAFYYNYLISEHVAVRMLILTVVVIVAVY